MSYYDPTGVDYGSPDTYNDNSNIDPNTGLPYGTPPTTPVAPTPTPTLAPGDGGLDSTLNPDGTVGARRSVISGGQANRSPNGDDTNQNPLPTPTPTPTPTPAPAGLGGVSAAPAYQIPSGISFQQDPQWSALVNQLVSRATQSLNIDPLTDPIIRPQVDNYGATQTRMANKAIDQQAESGSPYSTGSLQTARNQANEQAGFNTANLQSSLMTNELTARRNDIQNAMSTEGQMLTASQQLQLQQELGLIDENLKQQGINSGNDQFLATLGLNTNNQNNYWDAVNTGKI